jgi:hypothetical protein
LRLGVGGGATAVRRELLQATSAWAVAGNEDRAGVEGLSHHARRAMDYQARHAA